MTDGVGLPVLAPDRSQLEFSNVSNSKRRYIRSPKNPLDKSTIVSIFPKAIDDDKITIVPGKFHIDAGLYEKPSILIVGGSSWWSDTDVERPILEIPVSSIQVAESLVKDYCNGMFNCNMGDSMPGLFFVLGEQTIMDIKTKYKIMLEMVKEKQDNWFRVLVKSADSLWARSNGNPLVIWDEMRIAARSLNLNDKPWLKDFHIVQLVPCKFCGVMRNPSYPICQSCRAIDPSHPAAKDIKFAV